MADKISNARKKELEQPDPFLESLYNGMAFVRAYQKQLIWALCIVVAVVGGVAGTVYTIRSSETRAAALLAQCLERYDAADPQAGYDAVQADMASLMEVYPNTHAGKMGRVRFAEMAYDAGKFDQALDLYKAALETFDNDPLMGNLIQVVLGHTCLMLDKTDQARDFFKAVAEGNTDFLKDEALFNLALLAEKAGDSNLVTSYYTRIVSEHPQSIYSAIARAQGGENNS